MVLNLVEFGFDFVEITLDEHGDLRYCVLHVLDALNHGIVLRVVAEHALIAEKTLGTIVNLADETADGIVVCTSHKLLINKLIFRSAGGELIHLPSSRSNAWK